ncbi:hypothetical protein [Psychrobium sp. 1_MG-2023]|uniref:hypothetical protein n=1 Tax=Psychrobium sp. 1_MG-2023 TaxID=3062624 RepID=UPI000C3297C2|nr:hypothetical protein [Psychrobium sp. 1_MG-2023]MDP2562716.1 hypothetical protein [Psychrobium sp. 1_MG-2023]PKF54021.1 hypothetical protein CW748_17180 [Alteromonadales bacterium alter-6D02]
MGYDAIGESSSVKRIHDLVKRINSQTRTKSSLYEQAATYFAQLEHTDSTLETLKQNVADAQVQADSSQDKKRTQQLNKILELAKIKLSDFEAKLQAERLMRKEQVTDVCLTILEYCQGKNKADRQRKLAKILGTLVLAGPDTPKLARTYNQRAQHLYHALLSHQLLNQLIEDNLMNNQYIKQHADTPELFQDQVIIPLLTAALMQHVGNYHPDAQRILHGDDNEQDPFRVLEQQERLDLLKCNYQQTINYLNHGLGVANYTGLSREEEQQFNQVEHDKLAFINTLIKKALSPKQGLGNLLKVPQIYTSVVLSTKLNFNYEFLPRAFVLLNKSAEGGGLSKAVINCFLKIMGNFPQGFGVTYIPKGNDGEDLQTYEYAIVNGLYPTHPEYPRCRIVSRKLVFFTSGSNLTIERVNNLYYPPTKRKLETISKERLEAILSQLRGSSKFDSAEQDRIPSYWKPHDFFIYTRNQNLWNII